MKRIGSRSRYTRYMPYSAMPMNKKLVNRSAGTHSVHRLGDIVRPHTGQHIRRTTCAHTTARCSCWSEKHAHRTPVAFRQWTRFRYPRHGLCCGLSCTHMHVKLLYPYIARTRASILSPTQRGPAAFSCGVSRARFSRSDSCCLRAWGSWPGIWGCIGMAPTAPPMAAMSRELSAASQRRRTIVITKQQAVNRVQTVEIEEVPAKGRHPRHVKVGRVDVALEHNLERLCKRKRQFDGLARHALSTKPLKKKLIQPIITVCGIIITMLRFIGSIIVSSASGSVNGFFGASGRSFGPRLRSRSMASSTSGSRYEPSPSTRV